MLPAIIHYRLPLLDEQIHITQIGSGKQLMFAFHGYGLQASVFEQYRDVLSAYTIIAVDLPFHGNTNWKSESITMSHLSVLIKHYMVLLNVQQYALMGYSLGGKICMNIVQHFPTEVAKLILLAPDGLTHNRLFDFATYNERGKKIFRYAVRKPKYFITTIQVLEKIKIIPERNKDFYLQQLNNRQIRLSLYKIWNSFNQLRHDIPTVIQYINYYHIPVLLIMGKRDKLIKHTIGAKFAARIKDIQFVSLAKGHQLLDQSLSPYLNAFCKNDH
jgi:pimeloyl-ACP methyl ester carboxylesterase